jgi:crotonobetainyl-CoA:carnitine CoA-transferase CaiB-like acyl-CoA transferase
VVELGRGVAAPFCAKLLADLGADVIKVETPGEGDPARSSGPFPDDLPHLEKSSLFLYLNTSKRSVTLDLATAEGRPLFGRLLETADVLIEDLAPGELDRLLNGDGVSSSAHAIDAVRGARHARLAESYPGLVLTSITPFGQSGPRRHQRTRHLNLYHVGGQSTFWGSAADQDEPPPRGCGHLGEIDGGLTAAVATLAAVLGRRATGRGRHVDISMQEAMLCLERVDVGAAANDSDRRARPRMVGGLVPAKDGFVVITAVQEHQWRGLVRAMGEPAWASSSWCRDETSRTEHHDRIQPLIEAWTAGLDRDQIYHRCQAEGAPVGPVHRVDEVLAWQQARAREFFSVIAFPEAGSRVVPGAPYRFSRTPPHARAAPLLGEHNEEIFCGELGLSLEDLARLASSGVV